MTTIDCAVSESIRETPGSLVTPQEQCEPAGSASFPSTRAASSCGPDAAGTREGPVADVDGMSRIDENDYHEQEWTPQQTTRTFSSPLDQPSTWLMADSLQWFRRRVRNRRNGAVYYIRRVFRTGRVELERNGVTFEADVTIVRANYEACC